MKWQHLQLKIIIAIGEQHATMQIIFMVNLSMLHVAVTTVCSEEKPQCKGWSIDSRVKVSTIEGRCWKKTKSCSVGTTVHLMCKTNLQLFGPSYVTCNKDGWSTDFKLAQCKRANIISDIQTKTTPTVSLAYSGVKVPSLTDSVASLTSIHWSEIGWQFTVSCQTRWLNDTRDIDGVKLPKLYTKWSKIASDGSQVPVTQEMTSTIWSKTSPARDRTDLVVNGFQEIGNYTFKCTVNPLHWHPWSPLQATVEIRVTKGNTLF